MTRLAEVRSHVESIGELLEIVGAMRSLAGMRLREAQAALEGVRSYSASVASAIAEALTLLGDASAGARGAARRAVVLFAAEHGFVGAFNERLIDAARATLAPHDALLVLGSRGAALAEERGLAAAWTGTMPTHPSSASGPASDLASELYRRVARDRISRIELVYARWHGGASGEVARRVLLPLDVTALPARQPGPPPLHNLPSGALLERLTAEYVFALLAEGVVESIAAENAARLATMESARENVSKKLEELRATERLVRQEEITTELLEVAAGAEALGGA